MVIDGAFSAYGPTLDGYTSRMMWIERVLALVIAARFAGFAFPLASGLARGASALTGGAARGLAIDGTPVFVLVDWLGLLFGLARAVERTESPPEPTPAAATY